MSFGDLAQDYVRRLIDWRFRARSIPLALVSLGVAGLVAVISGFESELSIPFSTGPFKLSLNTGSGTPAYVVCTFSAVFMGLIGYGLFRGHADWRRDARKRLIVIEGRGLRDTSGTPLAAAIPRSIVGRREQLLVDLRQGIQDGVLVSPQAALERIKPIPASIKQRVDGVDREDITVIYGGLTSVPLTFLTGVLIDDESAVMIWDWDRNRERWRSLDGADDGGRFAPVDLGKIPTDAHEVLLAVSVSYNVDIEGVRRKFGDMPLVHLELEQRHTENHWSAGKQTALCQQFHDLANALEGRGVRRINMFLAAQNSVVFQFGRRYDKRNLPEVVVYQYERGEEPRFPWGVLMPVAGVPEATVIC